MNTKGSITIQRTKTAKGLYRTKVIAGEQAPNVSYSRLTGIATFSTYSVTGERIEVDIDQRTLQATLDSLREVVQ